MTDIVIPHHSSSLTDLCAPSADLDKFAAIRQAQIGCQSVLRDFAYCLAPEPGPQDLAITSMLNNLSEPSRNNLGCCIDQHGNDTVRLALFIEWVQSQLNADNASNTNSTAGIGATILGARSDSFMTALRQYQDALIKLNEYSRVGRGPAATRAKLKQNVKSAYERLNKYFQQEIQRLAPAKDFGRNKGTAITGADRGITLAERHKGRGIRIADMHEGRAVSRLSQSMTYAGRGIIAVDIGFRANKVHQKYQEDGAWGREIAVQTGGFGGATLTGVATGRVVAMTMVRVALAATPWGWALMIGSAVAVGAYAAYQADQTAQEFVGRQSNRFSLMSLNVLLLFDILFGICFLGSLLAWVIFGRLSMARIEKSIMAEGKPRPCSWDGVGGRVIWYAYTVALPASWFNELDDRQLNTADVKRYTTKADRIRAWALMVPIHGLVLLVAIATIFDIG